MSQPEGGAGGETTGRLLAGVLLAVTVAVAVVGGGPGRDPRPYPGSPTLQAAFAAARDNRTAPPLAGVTEAAAGPAAGPAGAAQPEVPDVFRTEAKLAFDLAAVRRSPDSAATESEAPAGELRAGARTLEGASSWFGAAGFKLESQPWPLAWMGSAIGLLSPARGLGLFIPQWPLDPHAAPPAMKPTGFGAGVRWRWAF